MQKEQEKYEEIHKEKEERSPPTAFLYIYNLTYIYSANGRSKLGQHTNSVWWPQSYQCNLFAPKSDLATTTKIGKAKLLARHLPHWFPELYNILNSLTQFKIMTQKRESKLASS